MGHWEKELAIGKTQLRTRVNRTTGPMMTKALWLSLNRQTIPDGSLPEIPHDNRTIALWANQQDDPGMD